MSMTKKERTEMDDLRRQLRMAKALRWTENIEPDILPPSSFNGLSTGFVPVGIWGSHAHVEEACSSSIYHAVGRCDKTTSQGSLALYSTKLLALKGLRHRMELICAGQLARIDEMIDGESI
jgi:hypothetical protein